MQKTLLVAYGLLLGLGVALLAWIIPAFTPRPSGYGISPAALPNLLAGFITVLAGWLLISTWRARRMVRKVVGRGRPDLAPVGARQLLHLARFAVVLFGAFPLMELVGFFPGSVAVLVLLQYLCGQRRLVPMLVVAVTVAGLVYAAARFILNVPLP